MAYYSFAQSIRNNGDRHARKASYWAEQGKPDYAEGSVAKARKNWTKADEFERAFSVPSSMRAVYDMTLRAIEYNLYRHTIP